VTPADEATFIVLWSQGASYAAIAQALGIPMGTVSSRAATLVRQGKISARPRGGAYPKQKAQARTGDPPAPPAPPVVPAPPAVTFVAVPEIQELLGLVKDLHARVGALEQTRVPPALPAPPATPAPPTAERKEIQQWTVRLSKALIDHLKVVAYERRIPPSQLVEEYLWQALTDRRP
jgi:DNA-binding transcriptional MocR family regulator